MKVIFFMFQGFFQEALSVFWSRGFGTDAFDTDTFQRAILYQEEGYLILCPMI